jgi:hypothetical protein
VARGHRSRGRKGGGEIRVGCSGIGSGTGGIGCRSQGDVVARERLGIKARQ